MQVYLGGAFRNGQQVSTVERSLQHNLACCSGRNALRATTINDFAKLATSLGGTPTIVERLARARCRAEQEKSIGSKRRWTSGTRSGTASFNTGPLSVSNPTRAFDRSESAMAKTV